MPTISGPELTGHIHSQKRYWDVPYLAQLTGARPSTIYGLGRKRLIPGLVKVGRLVRFDADKVQAWLDAGGSLEEAAGKSD